MSQFQIVPYHHSLARPVAELIARAFADHAALPPLTFRAPSPAQMTPDELMLALSDEQVRDELSFVALVGDTPVAAAIARSSGQETGWWRIATAPEHRRRGLAHACLEAGERAARAEGVPVLTTLETVDSRWAAAGALLRDAGYQLADPEQRNISMRLDLRRWQPRALDLPPGYELTTWRADLLEDWMLCRNLVFDSDAPPSWFLDQFASRPEFDPSGWHLVLHEGRVVAIAGALACRDAAGVTTGGMIEWVGVLPECRGLGLGETVVAACLNWLKAREVDSAVLLTQPFRVPAVRLYEKLGFVTFAAWHKYFKPMGGGQ